jgi:bifunctional non-homologous end joining protein LigD
MVKRRTRREDPVPQYRAQLARLVKEPPEGSEWLHEMKYDGYRIGCRIVDGAVRLISRNGHDWTAAYPEIVEAIGALRLRAALLDGEVAMLLPDGRTSFQALQNASRSGARGSLVYFVFDLLHLAGETLIRRPLIERKSELAKLLGNRADRGRIRYSEHVQGGGRRTFEHACRLRFEGIVSKRADAAYQSGRTDVWLKTKCILRQEFVIGGFTDPEGSRQGIGALLVGHYAAGRLNFAGKVGTGFTVAIARDLRKRLEAIATKNCPFDRRPAGRLGSDAHWVKPRLVAEVVFTEWTEEGKIRHPSFQGLRKDKKAAEVVREEPSSLPATRAKKKPTERPEVAGVAISHPDRTLYPQTTITKRRLAEYYERVGEWMVPHVTGRPLTLVRCPDGLSGECFYMKHSKVWAPPALRRVKIKEKTKVGDYLIADNVAGLVSLVQMGVLEIHTWNSTFEHVELPDRIVFDLDPGAKVAWSDVIAAARLVRTLLDRIHLASFAKTTGGRGLHVVVPLAPKADWPACLEFARRFAELIEERDPARYTTAFAKAGRERKILIDYLRNNRTNTSIAAYSTRAREGAPVSVPIRWAEVKESLDPSRFTIATVEQRLSRLRKDPWADYWTTRQTLPSALPRR